MNINMRFLCIGTSPYGVDVLDYTSAGVTNMAVVHSLKLQDGHTYYATIKGRFCCVLFLFPIAFNSLDHIVAKSNLCSLYNRLITKRNSVAKSATMASEILY